jgi:hypothetical protein
MPSANEQTANHLANRRVRSLIIRSRASQALRPRHPRMGPGGAPEGRDLYDRRVVAISAGPDLSLVPTRPDHLPTDRLWSCRCLARAPGDH